VDENGARYPGWRVAGASALGVFFASLLAYAFAVLLKPLAQEFSWSREAIASAYGIMAVVSAVAAPVVGRLLDRFGPRRVIVPCLIVASCAFASLTTLTARLWHLYLVFGTIGAVVGGTTSLAYSRAVSTWFDRRRGAALAVVIAGGAAGAIVHPPVTQALVERVGWRGACLVLGGTFLAVGLANVLAFVRERPVPGTDRGDALPGATVREALGSWVFWILVVATFGSMLAMNGAVVHLAALLTDRGVPATRAAVAVSAMGAASLAGRLLTGWLLDRYHGPRVAFGLLTVAGAGTFLLAGADSFPLGVLAAVLIGAGSGGELDVAPYLLSRYFGLRSLSALYGLAWTAMGLAGGAGPVLMGRAFDATGSYEAVLIQFAAGTVAIGVLMLVLPAYDPRYASTAGTRPEGPGPRAEQEEGG
jgi:MFS family permease